VMKPNPLASLKNLTVPVIVYFINYAAKVRLKSIPNYFLTFFIYQRV